MYEQQASLVISQFLLYMQNQGICLCRVFIGDDPQELTLDELNQIKKDFVKQLDG